MRKSPTVLVTGGGIGIGKEISKRLLDEGFDIIVHYFRSKKGAEDLEAYGKKIGRHVKLKKADFGRKHGISDLAAFVKKQRTDVRAVVHCAGHNEKTPYQNLTAEDFDRVFSINAKAPFLLTQSLMKDRLICNGGSVIFIASPNIFNGGGQRNMLYTASKSSLIALTRVMAKEFAPRVRVNCVVPGYIDTRMLRAATTRGELSRKKKLIPAGRFGAAHDVAALVAFLVSSESSYITGQQLHVNGGLIFG